jgi:fatty-acyl-CoA synthase
MFGLMMDEQLSIVSLLRFAARHHSAIEIVSRSVEGPIHRYTYRDAFARTGKLAHALTALGLRHGDRIATLAWNGYRHLELYYAIPGIGAICHTMNPRLFPDQIAYIVNHAADRVIFTEITFVPLLEKLAPMLPKVEAFVVMTDRAHMPATTLPKALCYEELLEGQPDTYPWPQFDERTASGLCYTSGTTGNPKGVLYSHRSTVLHALSTSQRDSSAPNVGEAILPIVPMFHVNAWGIPFAAPIGGFKLVFPGPRYDAESVYELLAGERVAVTAGVPTVWIALLDYLRKTGKRLPDLRHLGVGGSALSQALCEAFEKEIGVSVVHGWGMTETSPAAVNNVIAPTEAALPDDQRMSYKLSQGRGRYLVELKIVGPDGNDLPQDGITTGELCVRGPWIASAYYNDPDASRAWDKDGWFHTGDVASIDPKGYLRIVDRIKDIIKSGGEWISSIELENAAMLHPAVAEAAAFARPDPKWGERPVLAIRLRAGAKASAPDIVATLKGSIAKWALPEDVIFLDEFPYTATGKVAKRLLRERLGTAAGEAKAAS